MIQTILHYASLCAMTVMVFCGLWLMQRYTIGLIPALNKWEWSGVLYSLIALLIIWRFFTFSTPYDTP